MRKSELGLPLGYNELSKYYDVLSQGDDDKKNRVIEDILRKYDVQTVLDLTCGTGSQVFWLAKRGFFVTGADLSSALLSVAKEKARREKIDIKLIEGDMRTIQLGTFDAVITIFNAIGHLTKSGFETALKNIHKNLKKGGIYIFDIFNLNAITDKTISELAMDLKKTLDDTKIHNIQYSEIDRENGLLTSYDYFSIQEGSSEPKIYTGKFILQIYTALELREILARNGFETLGQYDIDGSKCIEDKSLHILTVAQKK